MAPCMMWRVFPTSLSVTVDVPLLGGFCGRLSSCAEAVLDEASLTGVAGRSAGVCNPITSPEQLSERHYVRKANCASYTIRNQPCEFVALLPSAYRAGRLLVSRNRSIKDIAVALDVCDSGASSLSVTKCLAQLLVSPVKSICAVQAVEKTLVCCSA